LALVLPSLSCQVFPEEQQESISEDEAERRGIPDLWIYSRSDGWAVVCECKVIAAPSIEQLQRHAKTARRLSFKQARLLVITADGSRPAAVPNRLNGVPVAWTTWPRVFDFLSRRYQYDHLVAEFLAYLRIVEGQAMDQGH
jgi:hypothetical protein